MGENTLYKRFLPLVILTVGILLQGCKDDVFNPEKVKAAYQDRFPVKNIDPAMDWKMTQQVRVNDSVSEDTGIDYQLDFPSENTIIKLNPDFKRNIYLVMKESIHNAIKYSKATLIKVSFKLEDTNEITTLLLG